MRGHGGPMFLPWHQLFVRLFEQALQEVSGKPITVPYRDWTREANPTDSTKNTVLSPLTGSRSAPNYGSRSPLGESFRNHIEGMRGDRPFPSLGPPAKRGIPLTTEQCMPDGFMFTMDGRWLHAVVHQRLGGSLEPSIDSAAHSQRGFGSVVVPTSPNDPMIFLLHASIDRFWASWQRRADGPDHYVPESGEVYAGNLRTDTVFPFDEEGRRHLEVTLEQVEDTRDLGYVYDTYDSDEKPRRGSADLATAQATTASTTPASSALWVAERRRPWHVCRLDGSRGAAS